MQSLLFIAALWSPAGKVVSKKNVGFPLKNKLVFANSADPYKLPRLDCGISAVFSMFSKIPV